MAHVKVQLSLMCLGNMLTDNVGIEQETEVPAMREEKGKKEIQLCLSQRSA